MNLPANWKTTVNGILAAIIGSAGPIAAYLATQGNKAAWWAGIVTLGATVARVWIGIIQQDSPTANQIGQIAITSVQSGAPPAPNAPAPLPALAVTPAAKETL
jgi:hypothetical protein